MVEAETLRRHRSCRGACDSVHPMAVANFLKLEKSAVSDLETSTPDNMMAARNGAASVEFRRVMASETDLDPADWPCQNKSHLL